MALPRVRGAGNTMVVASVLVAGAEQASVQILLLDPKHGEWSDSSRVWSVNADDGIAPLDNPHAAELLLDGNVAAVSSGGWLRVYTASPGAESEDDVVYPPPNGHGVLWDPEQQLYAEMLDRRSVKAISSHPTSGQVIGSVPKSDCAATWCTDTVEFFGPDMERTLQGAQLHKARWLVQEYQ